MRTFVAQRKSNLYLQFSFQKYVLWFFMKDHYEWFKALLRMDLIYILRISSHFWLPYYGGKIEKFYVTVTEKEYNFWLLIAFSLLIWSLLHGKSGLKWSCVWMTMKIMKKLVL